MSTSLAWLRLSRWGLKDYINKKVFLYKYPIQHKFRFIRLYKIKSKFSKKSTQKGNLKSKSTLKDFFDMHLINEKQSNEVVFLKLANPDNRYQFIYDELNKYLSESLQIIPIISNNSFSNLEIFSKYKNFCFKEEELSFYKLFKLKIELYAEFFIFSPMVLIWLFKRKRYKGLRKECILNWIKFIKLRRLFYHYYKIKGIKKIYYSYSSYGNESEFAALNSLGIETIEILHSHIHKDHFGYNRYFVESGMKDIFSPQKIIGPKAYESYFKNKFVYIISNNFLNFSSFKEKYPKEKNILVFGQPEQNKDILNFIKYKAFKNYKKIYFLPHPRDSYEYINKLNKYNIIIPKENLNKVMDKCSFFAVGISTMLMHLLETKKTTFILSNKRSFCRYLSMDIKSIPNNFKFINLN